MPRARRLTTASSTKFTPARAKGLKRRHHDLTHVSNSSPSNSSSNTDDSSDASSEVVRDIVCEQRQTHRKDVDRSRWSKVNWIGCESCDRWFHQCSTELPKNTDVSSIEFVCYNCK